MKSQNILVFRIGHLGDTLVALPAFWAIRKMFPKAKLTLLSNSVGVDRSLIGAHQVLPNVGLFDNYLNYPNSENNIYSLIQYFNLLKALHNEKFDKVFYLMTRNRNNYQITRDRLFFRLGGIKNIIGINYLSANLINYAETPLSQVTSETQFLLDCVVSETSNSITNMKSTPELLLNDDEVGYAEDWLSQNCGDFGRLKMVALAPGSKWSSKIWGDQKYLEVLEKLIHDFNVYPVILGGREDAESGKNIIAKLGRGANAAGELSVRQSAAVLSKCCLYLGNDTGTMHLAASVGLKCVAVFAAIDSPGRWHPFGENHAVFRGKVACEGCHSAICSNRNECLEQITPQAVYEACKKLL